MSLHPKQVEALLAPLDGRRVRKLDGNSHLESWDIRRHLLRVFGWGGWSFEVVSCDLILERSVWAEGKDAKIHQGRHAVAYRVVGRLTIHDLDGREIARFEDGATGDSLNQPSFGDAHDAALKTAMSQALKRCAVNLGDRFGLSLYNDGGTTAVVGKSVAHPQSSEVAASDHVEAGEQSTAQTSTGVPPSPVQGTESPAASAPTGSVPASGAEIDPIGGRVEAGGEGDLSGSPSPAELQERIDRVAAKARETRARDGKAASAGEA